MSLSNRIPSRHINAPESHDRDAAPRLAITVDPEPGGVRVRPRGEIDLATVDSVRRHIDECVTAGCERIVLDLRDVTFLDSTGLHLVLETHAAARTAEWELLLIEGPARVQQVFELAGVRDRLRFIQAPSPSTPTQHRAAAARSGGGRPV